MNSDENDTDCNCEDEMFKPRPKLDADLHCLVEGVNREWVNSLCRELNRRLGDVVNSILTDARTRRRLEKPESEVENKRREARNKTKAKDPT